MHSRLFGLLPTGEPIEAWVLKGQGGLTLEAITYGGTVTKLLAPDRVGHLTDVVFGFSNLSGYLECGAYFGAITGRVAGRLTCGTFHLDGHTYELARNDGRNHLHGGVSGFDKKVWHATVFYRPDRAPCLRLTYCSADGEEGYPGQVEITVTYTVTNDNVFLIETAAATQQSTPFNFTHHSYFNLAGEDSGSIANQTLQTHADEAVVTDSQMTLLGSLQSVIGQANDFRQPRLLGAAIPLLFQSHGDLYRLLKTDSDPVGSHLPPAARLSDAKSGRVLEVSTTEEYLQLYTAAALDGTLTGKSGVPYNRHAGVCLECEGYPDGPTRQPWATSFCVQANRNVVQRPTRSPSMAAFERYPMQIELLYPPPAPRRTDVRIGVLGSGFIVNDCHLVSYRKAGFNPVAIASRNHGHASQVAEHHGIYRVYETYEQLLDDPTIEVLDIAVPPMHQAQLIRGACKRATVKGILAQKPLALSYAEALGVVERCEAAGITLSVNQNMRYDPSVYAAQTLLRQCFFGTPVFATIDMRAIPHWQPWQAETGSASLRIMSIHHLDCMRYWFGDPESIFCSTRPDPRTKFLHTDGICTSILEYSNGLRCVMIDDVWAGPAKEGCPADIRIEWRIEGFDGLAIGNIGWCQDPYTTPSTMRFARKGDSTFRDFKPTASWFPDAFAGTMGQLLIALESGRAPAIDGRDNLQTIALVDAAVVSAAERRLVSPQEVISGAAVPTI